MQNTLSTNESASRVLIVDDEKAMAKALEIKLQKSGIAAHAVFSGDEAINQLKNNEYNLVLLDIMMPGIDGWAVLTKIKEMRLSVKVIITSNLSQEEDIVRAKNLGAIEFLIKSDSSLSAIIEEVKSYL